MKRITFFTLLIILKRKCDELVTNSPNNPLRTNSRFFLKRCWPITARWQILGVNQVRSCNFMYLGYTPRNTFAELFKAELTIPKYSCIFTALGSSLTRQFNHVGYYAAKFDLANPLGITNVLP